MLSCLTTGSDINLYLSAMGLFYGKVYSRVWTRSLFTYRYRTHTILFLFPGNLMSALKSLLVFAYHKYIFEPFTRNPYYILILVILLLLSNDVSENPGSHVDNLFVIMHINIRSSRL